MTPNIIVALISALYEVERDEVWGGNRTQKVCFVRAISFYLIHTILKLNFAEIGVLFKRSKTGVRKGYISIADQLSVDKKLQTHIEEVMKLLANEKLMQCRQN